MANEARGETTILNMGQTVWNTVKDSFCTVVSQSGKTYKLPLNQIPVINGNSVIEATATWYKWYRSTIRLCKDA